jgi:hypothetical protein
MFTVESHEFDSTTGIDTFVFAPIGMKALIKVVERQDGEPKVLLGVDATYVQQSVKEPEWTVCGNKEIAKIALEYYERRKEAS